MCQYDYYRYEECNHRVITVSKICNMKQWMAGMKGAVISCQEKYFTGPVLEGDMGDMGKWRWLGVRGWCVGCERELEVSCVLGFEFCGLGVDIFLGEVSERI